MWAINFIISDILFAKNGKYEARFVKASENSMTLLIYQYSHHGAMSPGVRILIEVSNLAQAMCACLISPSVQENRLLVTFRITVQLSVF